MVAVILENFTALGSLRPDLVSAHNIQEFKEAWGVFDPDALGEIDVELMPKLVTALRPPLGIRGDKVQDRRPAITFCMDLGLRQYNGKVKFREVLDALISANYKREGIDVEEQFKQVESAPPAVRAALEQKRKSIDMAFLFETQAQREERRLKMGMQLADRPFSNLVKRQRELWAAHPEMHPSHPGSPYQVARRLTQAPTTRPTSVTFASRREPRARALAR